MNLSYQTSYTKNYYHNIIISVVLVTAILEKVSSLQCKHLIIQNILLNETFSIKIQNYGSGEIIRPSDLNYSRKHAQPIQLLGDEKIAEKFF